MQNYEKKFKIALSLKIIHMKQSNENILKISVLNWDANASQQYDPYQCQLLLIFYNISVNLINIDINDSRFPLNWKPHVDQLLEPLTSIWIKTWSHWHWYVTKCGAIDIFSSRLSTVGRIFLWYFMYNFHHEVIGFSPKMLSTPSHG